MRAHCRRAARGPAGHRRAQPRRDRRRRRRRLARHDELLRLLVAGLVVAARSRLAGARLRPAGAGPSPRRRPRSSRPSAPGRARSAGGPPSTSWNILGSHDSARIRTVVGGDAAVHRVAAGLQFTLPGVPMIFAGDEIGLEGVNGEDSRRPMPWHRRDEWDRDDPHDVRRPRAACAVPTSPCAAAGCAGPTSTHDTIAFVREHPDGSVLVVARRAAGGAFALPLGAGSAPLRLRARRRRPRRRRRRRRGRRRRRPARLDIWAARAPSSSAS